MQIIFSTFSLFLHSNESDFWFPSHTVLTIHLPVKWVCEREGGSAPYHFSVDLHSVQRFFLLFCYWDLSAVNYAFMRLYPKLHILAFSHDALCWVNSF